MKEASVALKSDGEPLVGVARRDVLAGHRCIEKGESVRQRGVRVRWYVCGVREKYRE